MSLQHLNNDCLLSETRKLVQDERRVSLDLLYHLREIERRLLHAELGFSSLYEYVTRGLGYSEAAAHRRIQSARLLAECPELAQKIESGSLNLSLLAQVQTFCRNEEVKSTEKKREILKAVENKSSRDAEKELMSMTSEPAKHRPEKKKQVSAKYSEIRFMADERFVRQLEELKALLGSRTYQETIAYALQAGLDKRAPKKPKKKQGEAEAPFTAIATAEEVSAHHNSGTSVAESESIQSETESRHRQTGVEVRADPISRGTPSRNSVVSKVIVNSPPTSEVNSRYILVDIKRRVWARDQGQCTYRGADSGQRCQSKFGLEFDHCVTPFARGGKHSLENLTLRCKAHNQLGAVRAFGRAKMKSFVPSLGR